MIDEDKKMQLASEMFGLKPDTIRDLLDHGFELDRRFGSTEVRISRPTPSPRLTPEMEWARWSR